MVLGLMLCRCVVCFIAIIKGIHGNNSAPSRLTSPSSGAGRPVTFTVGGDGR